MKQRITASLIIAITLIIGFLLIVKIGKDQQTVLNTATPVVSAISGTSSLPTSIQTLTVVTLTPLPSGFLTQAALTLTAMPTIPPTATSTLAPPQCTFPLAEITTAELALEEYTFSEPNVVLTAEKGNIYKFVEWLPDNQQVLMTVDQYSTREIESDKFLRQSIELYNPETGKSKVYAIRHYIEESPSWQPALKAVVYPAMNFLGIDTNTNRPNFTRQLWVSYNSPETAQMLVDNLSQFPIAVKPDGSETIYLSDKKIFKKDSSLNDIISVPFDPGRWDYHKMSNDTLPISYKMIWQPGTALIFLYSNDPKLGSYTFILNSDTGQICDLNLDGWVYIAHWSSDGRYLASIRTTTDSASANLTDLVVLDTQTGNLYTIGVDGRYLYDFVWAPDNFHLLALGSTSSSENSQSESNLKGLYLIDFLSGQSLNLIPTYTLYTNLPQSIAWSSDGSKLLVRCPTAEEDRVCFISVQRIGK